MAFFQEPPLLDNQYETDRVLRQYLARVLPEDVLEATIPELHTLGELAGGELYHLQLADRLNEPRLTHFDAWGKRVDAIEVTPLWHRAARLAQEHGLVATAYEREYGAMSRVVQFSKVYLFDPSTDVYTCPLAMTDGAAATLLHHDNPVLSERAARRLHSRDPAQAWTSGQWMTERTGGSDVGRSETLAQPTGQDAYGAGPGYRLYGTKWFTSAATSQMALTLARPEGEPEGGRGLTLFYLETRDQSDNYNGITVNRLKDKLGTRKVPTAELTLDGALAVPVKDMGHGIRNITPMLNITRTWNAVCSAAGLRRGLALARDYAGRRIQFGAPLSEKPLHADTLAGLQAEQEASFQLAFRIVELIGKLECGEAGDHERALLRLLTPIAKLVTAKQAVVGLSETLEAFGGAGYVEDTGLPRLLRDAQVLPIWEGTTNVLSLDLLRAVGKSLELTPLLYEVEQLRREISDEELGALCDRAHDTLGRASLWLQQTAHRDGLDLEANARRLAITVGRSLQLALLARQGDYAQRVFDDPRTGYAARLFALHGIDQLHEIPRHMASALANDGDL